MRPDLLRGLFRSQPGAPQSEPPRRPAPSAKNSSVNGVEKFSTRQSRGLEQFFSYIRDQVGLNILDLSGATQDNVSFVTNLGHRISTQNFLRTLDDTFGRDSVTEQVTAGQIDSFLQQNLDYPDEYFDGVLVWDCLQFLSPALLAPTVERLHRITKRRSYLLAFFNADEKVATVPECTFRVQNPNTLLLGQRGSRKQTHPFNNRSLEKVFQQFESVKFFLTREHLREIIIKK